MVTGLQSNSTHEFVYLHVKDLSNAGKAPLSRYSGLGDARYMELRTRVRRFRQEYIFLRAVSSPSTDTLKEILDQDRINPNKPRFRGKTALHIATQKGNKEIVTILINGYADLSIKTHDGKTSLQLAVEKA